MQSSEINEFIAHLRHLESTYNEISKVEILDAFQNSRRILEACIPFIDYNMKIVQDSVDRLSGLLREDIKSDETDGIRRSDSNGDLRS